MCLFATGLAYMNNMAGVLSEAVTDYSSRTSGSTPVFDGDGVNNLFTLLGFLGGGVCLRSVSWIPNVDSVSGLPLRFSLTFIHLEMSENILSYLRYLNNPPVCVNNQSVHNL